MAGKSGSSYIFETENIEQLIPCDLVTDGIDMVFYWLISMSEMQKYTDTDSLRKYRPRMRTVIQKNGFPPLKNEICDQ